MKRLLIICSSLVIVGCSTVPPSTNELDKRSNHSKVTTKRSTDFTTELYVYPHEMKSGDYFKGGYIETVIQNGTWITN